MTQQKEIINRLKRKNKDLERKLASLKNDVANKVSEGQDNLMMKAKKLVTNLKNEKDKISGLLAKKVNNWLS